MDAPNVKHLCRFDHVVIFPASKAATELMSMLHSPYYHFSQILNLEKSTCLSRLIWLKLVAFLAKNLCEHLLGLYHVMIPVFTATTELMRH